MSAAASDHPQPPRRIDLDETAAYASYPQCLPGSTGLLLTMGEPGGERVIKARYSFPLAGDYAAVGVLPLPPQERRPRRLLSRGYAPRRPESRLPSMR